MGSTFSGVLGDVHAELFVERLQDLRADLGGIVLDGPEHHLVGDVGVGDEALFTGDKLR